VSDIAKRLENLSPERRELLAQRLAAQRHLAPPLINSVLPLIVPNLEERYQPFPLTDPQQVYWIGRSGFFDLSACGTNVYLEFELVDIGLPFLSRFNAAFHRLIERHEMLRAIILPDGRQSILPHVPSYEVSVVDLRAHASSVVEMQLAHVREHMSLKQGAIDRWPLFDFLVHLLDNRRIRLHMRFESFIIDGTSRGIFLRELQQLIAHPETTFMPLECSYRDYALTWRSFQQSELYQRSRSYWLGRLPLLPSLIELPQSERIGPLTPSRFVNKTITLLDAENWRRLKTFALQAGLTASSVVIAAFTEILAILGKSKHFLLGLAGSYRPPIHPQIQQIIGNFNTIYLLEVKHTASTFTARAGSLQKQLMQDLEHQYFSGFQVLREINRIRKNGTRASLPLLFNCLIEHGDSSHTASQQRSEEMASSSSLVVQGIYIPQISLFPTVIESPDGMLLCLRQSVDTLFFPGFLNKMFAAYQHLLLQLAQDQQKWFHADLESLLPDWLPSQTMVSGQEAFPENENQQKQQPAGVNTARGPRDALEHRLVQLWKDLLSVPFLTPGDDFFALGGNSLLFVSLMQRMREQFGIELPPGIFPQGGITIEYLADTLRQLI
jgi:pyochelin synthetase